jgi:hypothetical protein
MNDRFLRKKCNSSCECLRTTYLETFCIHYWICIGIALLVLVRPKQLGASWKRRQGQGCSDQLIHGRNGNLIVNVVPSPIALATSIFPL